MVDTFSIKPTQVDLDLTLGDEFGMTMVVNVDLTGYTFEATIGTYTITTELLSATSTPTPTSRLKLSLQETEVSGLGQGEFPWRLRWTAPGSVRRTAIAGTAKVTSR